MRTRLLILSLMTCFVALKAQTVNGVYKVDALLKRISHPDTIYVVNFWATWCKPCVKELPAFDSLGANSAPAVKVLLVSLDFKEELAKKVNPFLTKNKVKTTCVLLDEVNGNDFINKISPRWSGAIPATLFRHGDKVYFLEQQVDLKELRSGLKQVE